MAETDQEIERLNRRAWSKPGVVDYFSTLADWSEDAGEPVVVARIAAEVAGRPILDVGIGGGRTVPILMEISKDYVGIDYTPEMVAAARARFPTVRLEQGDARDLAQFADGSFALVFFSANGLDAVSHEGRGMFFREAHRVLEPGGVLAFSTHNLDHRNAGRALGIPVNDGLETLAESCDESSDCQWQPAGISATDGWQSRVTDGRCWRARSTTSVS